MQRISFLDLEINVDQLDVEARKTVELLSFLQKQEQKLQFEIDMLNMAKQQLRDDPDIRKKL